MRRKRSGNTLGAVIITLVLLGIGVGGVYLMINSSPVEGPEFSMNRSGIMKTTVRGDDGESHSLQARFALEVKNDLSDTVDTDALFGSAERTLGSLDYEAAIRPDGIEYAKEQLMESLSKHPGFNPEAVSGIYMTDFLLDYELGTGSIPDDNPDAKFNKAFDSLFKNAK